MALRFASRVEDIPAYPIAQRAARHRTLVCMASNELAYAPIPAVREAIVDASSTLNRYPDPGCIELRVRLSDSCHVPFDNIAVGNGSCDLLLALGATLLEAGTEMVCAWPSFAVYRQLAAATGSCAITVPLDEAACHDLPRMLAAITAATRLVIVCNPNNPTGTALPPSHIERFLDQAPRNVCVLLDEAYREFNTLDEPGASVQLLARHPNLMLLRTFSKVYGLSGLRVGYALCGDDALPRALDIVRQPFSCNAVAQAAATESLSHHDVVVDRAAKTLTQRDIVTDGLGELGLTVAESQANFCWVDLCDAEREDEVMRGLAERGVLVRGGRALGHEGAMRVTYGTAAENTLFLAALTESLDHARLQA
jgi:histidinol-phosphate aminotransferase